MGHDHDQITFFQRLNVFYACGTRWNTLSAPVAELGPAPACLCLPWTEVTRDEQGLARLFSIGHLPALTGLTGSSCIPDAVSSRTAGERRGPD